MRERERTQMGSWRDCESQARDAGRSRGGIWSPYSKCSVTKVSDPTLCGAFHFPGARNRAQAERVRVCVPAHMCPIVCLRCPCDPILDSRAHTRTGAHTLIPTPSAGESVSARARAGAGGPKHVHSSTLKTQKVCCEGAHA